MVHHVSSVRMQVDAELSITFSCSPGEGRRLAEAVVDEVENLQVRRRDLLCSVLRSCSFLLFLLLWLFSFSEMHWSLCIHIELRLNLMRVSHHVLVCAWIESKAEAVVDRMLHVRSLLFVWSVYRHILGSESTLNEQSWSPVV